MNEKNEGERDQQQPWLVYFGTLKPADVFRVVPKRRIGIVQPGVHEGRGDGLSHIIGNSPANMVKGPNTADLQMELRCLSCILFKSGKYTLYKSKDCIHSAS